MSYQVLARKYRPQKFSDVIGQSHVTRTLQNAIEQQRIAHGYIFSGHRGIGKTTIARILAMALNCRSADHPVAEPCGVCESCTEIRDGSSVDVMEIDAATNRGIDEIRELRDAARYRPARDRFKIYILDEAHQITDAAFNALLKTLEEPPSHVVFMMATTQPEDIPQTIRSRCQHFSFHAVKFDDIIGQLRDIAGREKIAADDNSLAMLAEAGDGSMRDALSIMDQAIACCGERLTGATVLQLVGSVPSQTLEDMMGAVARNSSEDVMRMVDRLITEGQSPAHFARQLVRFLRNTVVAKVAGGDSSLLQISTDERARVARVAAQFGEEDLTRFLQIMLRTHNELSYKQEQRFHLELGLLKMVHAQRLLPMEQLLSRTAGESAAPVRASTSSAASKTQVSNQSAPRTGSAGPSGASDSQKSSRPSPFESDRSRKTAGVSDSANPFRRDMSSSSAPSAIASTEIVGTSARAVAVDEARQPAVARPLVTPQTVAQPVSPAAAPSELSSDDLRNQVRERVLSDLDDAGQKMLATMLEDGEWSVDGSEVVVKIAKSTAVIEMSMGADAKRVGNAATSAVLGRPAKLKVVSGTPANGTPSDRKPRATAGNPAGTARARAAEDPVVRRMQEKFGAEIRSVIDHREKR
jgi:DNA polymerase-3 subunit gamma/tau